MEIGLAKHQTISALQFLKTRTRPQLTRAFFRTLYSRALVLLQAVAGLGNSQRSFLSFPSPFTPSACLFRRFGVFGILPDVSGVLFKWSSNAENVVLPKQTTGLKRCCVSHLKLPLSCPNCLSVTQAAEVCSHLRYLTGQLTVNSVNSKKPSDFRTNLNVGVTKEWGW